ncbi:glycosyltransferase family 39 protein [Candidatus Woesearchaeota archaeon]|nr:glycosyltransferase family 39 protein [Candidatus Woesearchaeota archaeon]
MQEKKDRRYDGFFILILLVGIAVRLYLDTSYFFWDETNYIMNAQQLATGSSPHAQFYERPILLPLILVPIFNSELIMVLVMVLLNSLSIVMIYNLGLFYGKKTARISMVILALFPFHILTSRWVMTDSLAMLLAMIAVWSYWKGIERKSLLLYLLGGFFVSLSFLMKFTYMMIVVLLFTLFLLKRPKLSFLLYSAGAAIATLLPFFIFNITMFKDPFYPILRATHVIATPWDVSLFFIILQIVLFLGLLVIPIVYSIIKGKDAFLIFWLLFTLAFFVSIVKGVAMPETMEWEVQRFLFPVLAPAILLAAISLRELSMKRLAAFFLVFILVFAPSYITAYTPKIALQEGLREVSKDMGIYLKNNIENDSCVYNVLNWPVLGYYSQRKVINDVSMSEGCKTYYVEITKEPLNDSIKTVKSGKYFASVKILPDVS